MKSVKKKLGLRSSFILIITAGVAFLMLTVIMTVFSKYKLEEATKEIGKIEEVLLRIETLNRNVNRADLGLRGFLIIDNDQMLSPYRDALKEYEMNIFEMKTLLEEQGFKWSSISEGIKAYEDYMKLVVEMVNMVKNGNKEGVLEIVYTDPGYDAWQKYGPAFSAIQEFEEAQRALALEKQNAYGNRQFMYQLFVLIIMAPLLIYVVAMYSKSEKKRRRLFDKLLDSNKKYIFNDGLKRDSIKEEQEIIDELVQNLEKANDFIYDVAKGDFNREWEGLTQENIKLNEHNLTGALIAMKEEMRENKEADEIRIWVTEGLSKFADIVRNSQDHIEELSTKVIAEVVKYLGINQGGMFVLGENEKNEKVLKLQGCYAYNKKKFLEKTVNIGDGLLGQCYLEKEPIYLKEIPDGYTSISSGLGDSTPKYLLLVPMAFNDKIEGIMELASFDEIPKHAIDFLVKLGEIIASTIVTARVGEETKRLLTVANEQREEMQAQEEEMRQNMEEMQATQEQLSRQMKINDQAQEELMREKMLIDTMLKYIPDSIYFKDKDSRFIKASNSMATNFKVKNVEEIYGKSDFDFFTEEHARPAFEDEQEIIKTGVPMLDKIEKETHTDGTLKFVSTTKMPLYDNKGNIIGTFGISKDVTETQQMQAEIRQRNEELLAQEEELRQNLEEMQATQEELQRQMDVSRKSQEELANEKMLIDTMLTYIPDSIYFKDLNSRFIKATKSLASSFNTENVEDIYGKSDFDYFTEEHARPAYEDEQEIIKTGKPIIDKIEKETHTDGTVKYVSTTKMPLYNNNGDIIGTFGISKDVTESIQMQEEIKQTNEELLAQEEELRQNLEEMQATQEELERQMEVSKTMQEDLKKEKLLIDTMLKNIPDRIYFKDSESRFIKATQSMAAGFKVENVEEIYGKSDFDYYTEEHARPAYEDEQEIIRTGKPMVDKIEKETRKDGTVLFVSTTKMPLYDEQGKIIGTFGISKDVTEVKMLEMATEEQKKQMNEQKEMLLKQLKGLEEAQKQMDKKIETYEKEIKELKNQLAKRGK